MYFEYSVAIILQNLFRLSIKFMEFQMSNSTYHDFKKTLFLFYFYFRAFEITCERNYNDSFFLFFVMKEDSVGHAILKLSKTFFQPRMFQTG